MLEADVEDTLVEGVEGLGGLCWKLRFAGITGLPDRLVLLPGGRVIFVELKKPDGKKSTRQGIIHGQLRRLGMRVEVLWSIQQVQDFLVTL